MILFPNAKINLGLHITARRADGYHDLDTVFYPIPLCDSLEVVPRTTAEPPSSVPNPSSSDDCLLHLLGAELEGDVADNLVVRAYRRLKSVYPALPPVEVWLYKRIPSGAGLGGGSADATFMLRLLNRLFGLGLTDEALAAHAASLGADCPFFVFNTPARATGTGNIFTPVTPDLKGYGIVVVKPPVFVSTREAFSRVTPAVPAVPLTERIARPVATWRDTLVNDFEQSLFPLHPELKEIKDALYRHGATYASMSGSGSALYGLFAPGTPLPDASLFPTCFVWTGNALAPSLPSPTRQPSHPQRRQKKGNM